MKYLDDQKDRLDKQISVQQPPRFIFNANSHRAQTASAGWTKQIQYSAQKLFVLGKKNQNQSKNIGKTVYFKN